jgi:hypothetical protein
VWSTDKPKGERIDGLLIIQIRQGINLNLESGAVSLIRGGVNQFEFDSVAAFGAARKCLTLQKGDFMRQPMLMMDDFVNSAVRDLLAGLESWCAHNGRYSSANLKGAT